MKTKIIIPIFFLTILSLSVFVSAVDVPSLPGETSVDTTSTNINIQIVKGWNLVPTLALLSDDFLGGSEMGYQDFKYGYVYDSGKYSLVIENGKYVVDNVQSLSEPQSSMWVYSEKEGNLNIKWGEFQIREFQEFIGGENYELKSGWNFVSSLPEMIQKSLTDFKGNCNIQKAYFWNAEEQDWSIMQLTQKFNEDSLIGGGFVIKVSSDCKFATSESSVKPPQLPNSNNNPRPNPNLVNSDFPKTIGEFTLKSLDSNNDTECTTQLNGDNVCAQTNRIEYVTSNNKAVYFLPIKITSGKDSYVDYIKTQASETNVDGVKGVYRGAEPWELYWFTNDDYDAIGIQSYSYTVQSDGSQIAQPLNGTTTSSVVQWLLNKYPPVTL